jgi:hypothetical protein
MRDTIKDLTTGKHEKLCLPAPRPRVPDADDQGARLALIAKPLEYCSITLAATARL